MKPVLHSYWRGTAPYRVRIALGLKGLEAEIRPVDLAAGEQAGAAYAGVNPQRLTPALEIEGKVFTQSLAILEWLEETRPNPALLPADPDARARVRAMALTIACDIHPLNNLRVLKALRAEGLGPERERAWIHRWMEEGFSVLEAQVAAEGRGWCFGSEPTVADCCLIPQIYSARRFGVDLGPYPSLRAVAERAAGHPAFAAAAPERQPDAPPPAG